MVYGQHSKTKLHGMFQGGSIKEILYTGFKYDESLLDSNIHPLIYDSVLIEKDYIEVEFSQKQPEELSYELLNRNPF